MLLHIYVKKFLSWLTGSYLKVSFNVFQLMVNNTGNSLWHICNHSLSLLPRGEKFSPFCLCTLSKIYFILFLQNIFHLIFSLKRTQGSLYHWFLTLGYSGVLDYNSQKPSPPAVLTGVSGSCSSKASE